MKIIIIIFLVFFSNYIFANEENNEELEVIDLCRPCRHLSETLGHENIIKEFLRRGGLRCQILSSSKIKVGDEIKIID